MREESNAQSKHAKEEHGKLGYWTIGKGVLAGGMKDVTIGSGGDEPCMIVVSKVENSNNNPHEGWT
jgi:hypothetical protein